jgi:hypothetical protein
MVEYFCIFHFLMIFIIFVFNKYKLTLTDQKTISEFQVNYGITHSSLKSVFYFYNLNLLLCSSRLTVYDLLKYVI